MAGVWTYGMDMDELAEDQKQNNHLQLRCQGVSSLWPLWDMETRHGSRGPHGDEPHTRRSNKMRAHSYGPLPVISTYNTPFIEYVFYPIYNQL